MVRSDLGDLGRLDPALAALVARMWRDMLPLSQIAALIAAGSESPRTPREVA